MISLPPTVIDQTRGRPVVDLAISVDALIARAQWLLPEDRLAVELALRNRVPHRQIGIALRVPAGTVSRRLRRIVRRLNDPLAIALLNQRCPLPADHHEVGIGHFVQGLSTGALARKHSVSPGQIRRMITYVR